MNQIEFLLRLSENAQDEGEALAKRQNAERDAFIRGLLDLEKMIELARQNVHAELGKWGVTPQGQLVPDKMPRIVQKGPAAVS